MSTHEKILYPNFKIEALPDFLQYFQIDRFYWDPILATEKIWNDLHFKIIVKQASCT